MPSPWGLDDVLMFIQDEGIVVNKLIEVLIKKDLIIESGLKGS